MIGGVLKSRGGVLKSLGGALNSVTPVLRVSSETKIVWFRKFDQISDKQCYSDPGTRSVAQFSFDLIEAIPLL